MILINIDGHIPFSMTVNKTDTVSTIKEEIKKKINCPNINDIELQNKGRILKDDTQLKDLRIKQNDRFIYTTTGNIVGGFSPFGYSMANIANEAGLEKRNFGKGKNWNKIIKGLNIEGTCNNDNCVAYNHKVDCQIGLGDFNVLEKLDEIKCPMCHDIIDLNTCSFCECQYQIEGKLTKTGKAKDIETIRTEWKKVEKDYDYYDPIKSGTVTWTRLIIHTKDL